MHTYHELSPKSFQLTSSRRGWHAHSPLLTVQGCHFNSHPHEEDDPASWIPRSSYRHFNSHPHEEDDCSSFKSHPSAYVFQLTSSRRGWPVCKAEFLKLNHFNSHPHEEDDVNLFSHDSASHHFNSHPHEEDDSRGGFGSTGRNYFNSHPHEEDDRYSRCFGSYL